MKSPRDFGRSFVCATGLTILLIALLPLATGCGGDDGGTQPPPPDGETIGPAGGTATSDDANAAVVVPAGALADETAITVTTAAAPPPDYISGTAYDFGPDGTQFDAGVALTIGYAPADLPAGTEPDSLKLCRAVGGWIPLDVFTHDAGAHTLSGEVTHFSTYGIVAFAETEPADLTAYLKDEPAAGADNEFATLVEALAWLQAGLDYEDTGTLVWQTDTVQQVEQLAFSFDLTISVDPGRTPAIAGPAGDALVIDAGGAVTLSEVAVTAPGGLVLNANRALNVAGCDLPATVFVNIGGVRGAPYPAGDPGSVSKSPAAYRRSRGTVIANNRGMQNLGVGLNAAAQHSGDLTVSGNETTYLNVGGTSVLAPNVCLTVAGPASIPMPYPNIAVNTDGTSQVQVLNMTGVVKLRTKVTAGGVNPIDIREIQGTVSLVDVAGSGSVSVLFVDSNVDSTVIQAAAARSDITLIHDKCRSHTAVLAGAAQDQLQLKVDGGTYEGNLTVELPSSGQADVTLDGATHSDGRLVVSGGGKGTSRGAITLRDLTWQGSQSSDHVDINGTDCGVTISGGTYTHSGSPAVVLGLTEVTGAISIQGVSLTGGGVGPGRLHRQRVHRRSDGQGGQRFGLRPEHRRQRRRLGAEQHPDGCLQQRQRAADQRDDRFVDRHQHDAQRRPGGHGRLLRRHQRQPDQQPAHIGHDDHRRQLGAVDRQHLQRGHDHGRLGQSRSAERSGGRQRRPHADRCHHAYGLGRQRLLRLSAVPECYRRARQLRRLRRGRRQGGRLALRSGSTDVGQATTRSSSGRGAPSGRRSGSAPGLQICRTFNSSPIVFCRKLPYAWHASRRIGSGPG